MKVKRLHDCLDYKRIKVITINNEEYIGTPVSVSYPDDTGYKEDILDLEKTDGSFIGFGESDIESIEIIEE